MTLASGPATRLTIFVNENDQWHHRPLHTEIVHRAHRAGLAGASTFHGSAGFGRSDTLHTAHILSLSDDLPCAIVIVDTQERVRAFVSEIEELLVEALVTLDEVEVVVPDVARPKGQS